MLNTLSGTVAVLWHALFTSVNTPKLPNGSSIHMHEDTPQLTARVWPLLIVIPLSKHQPLLDTVAAESEAVTESSPAVCREHLELFNYGCFGENSGRMHRGREGGFKGR